MRTEIARVTVVRQANEIPAAVQTDAELDRWALDEARRSSARGGAMDDRMNTRLATAGRALASFQEALDLPEAEADALVRDACIQRVKYTFDAGWKAAREYLSEREGLAANSPKATWRGLGEVGVLNPQQVIAALAMTDDRNLTSHTYNETLAREIFSRLGEHAALLAALLEEIKVRLS